MTCGSPVFDPTLQPRPPRRIRRWRRPQVCPSRKGRRVACEAESSKQGSLNTSIAAIALPALGTELIDPLLSLCDTAFVGRISAEQLAGVGIASSVFTYTFLFFNFLSTASAPLVARALARCAATLLIICTAGR